jgi:hypothetical protein
MTVTTVTIVPLPGYQRVFDASDRHETRPTVTRRPKETLGFILSCDGVTIGTVQSALCRGALKTVGERELAHDAR